MKVTNIIIIHPVMSAGTQYDLVILYTNLPDSNGLPSPRTLSLSFYAKLGTGEAYVQQNFPNIPYNKINIPH